MARLRRRPHAVTHALRRARRVLIVCHGNIIRSPFAATLLARTLGGASGVSVSSAGLEAIGGRPADGTALEVAKRWRVDLAGHHARPLAHDIVADSDVIFVMEAPHLVQLRRRFPEAADRTFFLTCLAPSAPLEIGDPWNCEPSVFETCFSTISQATEPIARALCDTAVSALSST
jgi:low molecular weight protein-tyrosine phosphatase